MAVATSGLKPAPKDHYYEVCLVDTGRSCGLPLGILPPSGRGRFSFPIGLWGHGYAGVTVSLESSGAPPTTGIGMLSTLAKPHRTPSHLLSGTGASHPKRHAPGPGAHHHRRTPPRRVSGQPSPVILGQTHTPPAVRRLLHAKAPKLTSSVVLHVDTTADSDAVDPASGTCRDSEGRCSLRAAVEVADARAAPVTIRLPAGRYVLDLGSLVVTDRAGVAIVGASPAATVLVGSVRGQARVLTIEGAPAGAPRVASAKAGVVSPRT